MQFRAAAHAPTPRDLRGPRPLRRPGRDPPRERRRLPRRARHRPPRWSGPHARRPPVVRVRRSTRSASTGATTGRPATPRRCVIAEVHNTYGGRHCYLLAARRAVVTPTWPRSSSCRRSSRSTAATRCGFSEPGDDLEVSIVLRRGENMEPVFRAKLAGHRDGARSSLGGRAALAARVRRAGRSSRSSGGRGSASGCAGSRSCPPARADDPRDRRGSRACTGASEPHRSSTSRRRAGRPVAGARPRRRTSRCTPRSPSGSSTGPSGGYRSACELPDGSIVGGRGVRRRAGRCASSTSTAFFDRLGADGLIGFGESYMAGDWDADDLAAVLSRSRPGLATLVPGVDAATAAVLRAAGPCRPRANTLDGARRNIAAPLRPVE